MFSPEQSSVNNLPEQHNPIVRREESGCVGLAEYSEDSFGIFGRNAQDIHQAYAEVVKWLKMPYIHDDFSDHLDRRKWFDGLNEEQRREMEHNKFRNNTVAIAILNLNNLKSYLSKVKGGPKIAFPEFKEEMSQLRTETEPLGRRKVLESIEKKISGVVANLNSYIEIKKGVERDDIRGD